MMTRVRDLGWFGASMLVMAGLVGIWHLLAESGLVSPIFLPKPASAFQALTRGLSEGDLAMQLGRTVLRMTYGWLLASALAIVLGMLIGISVWARAALNPMLELIRPLPASAMVPVAIVMFGLTETMVLFVIVFGSLWPVLLATVHGVTSVEPRLHEVARVLTLGRIETIWKILLPAAMPDILAGMRLGLTAALILTVVGEMLSSQDGLGQAILLAGRSFQSANLYSGIILLGLVGLVSGLLVSFAEKRLLVWHLQGRE